MVLSKEGSGDLVAFFGPFAECEQCFVATLSCALPSDRKDLLGQEVRRLESSRGLGKRAVAQRLCGSLQVDIAKTRRLLGWNPPLTLDQGLKKAVEDMKP